MINLSIRDMFRLERPLATDDEIWEALERTNVRTYVHHFKDKLNTKFNLILAIK